MFALCMYAYIYTTYMCYMPCSAHLDAKEEGLQNLHHLAPSTGNPPAGPNRCFNHGFNQYC